MPDGLNDYRKILAQPVILKQPIDSSWTVNQTLKNPRIPVDEEGNALVLPVFQFGAGNNNVIATIRKTNNATGQTMTSDNTLSTTSILYLDNGTTQDLVPNANLALGATINSLQGRMLPIVDALPDLGQSGAAGIFAKQGCFGQSQTSATNAPQTITVALGNLHDHLTVIMSTSGGTATLVIKGSVDNSTYTTLISLAASATQTLDLVGAAPLSSTNAIAPTDVSNPVTSGGAVTINSANNPLAFRYIQVIAGTAGVGNTTTLTVSAK